MIQEVLDRLAGRGDGRRNHKLALDAGGSGACIHLDQIRRPAYPLPAAVSDTRFFRSEFPYDAVRRSAPSKNDTTSDRTCFASRRRIMLLNWRTSTKTLCSVAGTGGRSILSSASVGRRPARYKTIPALGHWQNLKTFPAGRSFPSASDIISDSSAVMQCVLPLQSEIPTASGLDSTYSSASLELVSGQASRSTNLSPA